MRVERNSSPNDMSETFSQFVTKRLKGISLDANFNEEAKHGKFPDFTCFNGLALLEVKQLKSDQNERLNETIENNESIDNKINFYGKRSFETSFKDGPEKEEIRRQLHNKLSRTIEDHLRKAKEQLKNYSKRNPRKNRVNICIFLNNSIGVFTPDLFASCIDRKMNHKSKDSTRYNSIDYVIYISEKHYIHEEQKFRLTIWSYTNVEATNNPWKDQVIEKIITEWTQFRGAPISLQTESLQSIENSEEIIDIPKKMTRSEQWAIEYQRYPYLSEESIDNIRIIFHRTLLCTYISIIKGKWKKPTKEQQITYLRNFSHVIEEINRRGLDMNDMNKNLLSEQEITRISKGIPQDLIDLIFKEKPNY
ncbi:hypothetical protein [Thalassospira sp. TSL5-1]|uniref:hypothetical protein n=1 Tax=Thalassospira sp. TSL5-1 TaxID=1544451 RepID=UPI00093E91AC|nr:hypothetical protein [Thalassospira sp. TSL5-1]OKH90203.1 hypothetical protein LF95_10075 [Thalassospira sp. TSL5-1]